MACDGAKQVKLVLDFPGGASQIFPLAETAPGVWETQLRLTPGEYRFCYHAYDGRSLRCLTPSDFEADGLKAILHVNGGRGRHADQPNHSHALRRQHPMLAYERTDRFISEMWIRRWA